MTGHHNIVLLATCRHMTGHHNIVLLATCRHMTGHHNLVLLATCRHMTGHHNIHVSCTVIIISQMHVISKVGHYNANRRTDTSDCFTMTTASGGAVTSNSMFHVVSMETKRGTLKSCPTSYCNHQSANHGNKMWMSLHLQTKHII
jgi:hypothetical protein